MLKTQIAMHGRTIMLLALILVSLAMMAFGATDVAACNVTGGGDFPC